MQITAKSAKLENVPTQYTVYAYDKYSDILGYNKWQCLLNSDNKKRALAEAERLFDTDKFQKIEVKKKVFNPKQKRYCASTYRVLDTRPKRNLLLIGALALLAFSSMVLLLLEML